MLGYTAEEILGRRSFDFIHRDELPRAAERWASRGDARHSSHEYRFLRKDGSVVWLDASSRSLLDADGRFLGAFGMFTEITLRKAAEAEREAILERERQARAEAEEANRIKDEFLATVSHELRTPLNAIVAWIHLLRARQPDPATLERGLTTIERNIQGQVQIIDDILDVSRIIRGSLALEMQPVDLALTAGQAIESLRPAAEAKGVAIEPRLGGPPESTVLGDPDRLQQVIWNLLSNAVKFTPRGGKVELALLTTAGQTRIVVADTGQGIAPEFLPHVFERFRQADGSTTRLHSGLGLGLAIVRHLIELHGGTVTAESAGLGQGARFTVHLPTPPETRC
jgi:PAS domain S-box-containing protein